MAVNREVVKLGLFGSFFSFATFLYVPLISPYLKDILNELPLYGLAPEIWLGIIFAAYPIAIILGTHAMGTLSDQVGRRSVIVVGLLFSIASILLFLLAKHPLLFFLAKGLEALGFASVAILLMAKVNDLISDKQRGTHSGVYLSLQRVGGMLGPPIGAWLTVLLFPKAPFIAGLIITASLLAFLLIQQPLHLHKASARSFNLIRNVRQFLGFRKLKGMAILGVAMHTHLPTLNLFLPLFLLERFPGRYEVIGYAFLALGAIKPLQFITGRMVDHYGKKRMTVLGCVIVAIGLFLVPTVQGFWPLMAVFLLISAGNALWNVGAWTVMSVIGEANHIEGHVVGSYSSIAKVGDLAGSLAFGFIAAAAGTALIFHISGYIVLAGILLSLIFLKD